MLRGTVGTALLQNHLTQKISRGTKLLKQGRDMLIRGRAIRGPWVSRYCTLHVQRRQHRSCSIALHRKQLGHTEIIVVVIIWHRLCCRKGFHGECLCKVCLTCSAATRARLPKTSPQQTNPQITGLRFLAPRTQNQRPQSAFALRYHANFHSNKSACGFAMSAYWAQMN